MLPRNLGSTAGATCRAARSLVRSDGQRRRSARGLALARPERRRPHRSGDRRRRRARGVAQQRRRAPVAASGPDRPREQPARDQVGHRDAMPAARARGSSGQPRHRPSRRIDVVFGLGSRPGADAVRVLWPSGILQAGDARVDAAVAVAHRGAGSETLLVPLPLHMEWRALRVRHRLHGRRRDGVLGRPGQCEHAGSAEYVRISGDQLRAKDGRLELRVTNELERGAVRRSLVSSWRLPIHGTSTSIPTKA